MPNRVRALLLACLVAIGAFGLAAPPARANTYISPCDELRDHPNNSFAVLPCVFESLLKLLFGIDAASNQAAVVATPVVDIQEITNVDGTLQAGEPVLPGMTRTGWVGFKASRAARIVVHTFGSEPWDTGVFDPLLAVYRGTAFSNLVRIASNDNTPLAGVSVRESLVQFDVVAGQDYRVQVGSKNNVEGVISLNGFGFPPGGGLSAFLSQYGGTQFNGRDYVCDFYAGPSVTTSCPSAKFILHNSTNGTLNVTASSSLGPGVVATPATFALAKGALKVVTFTFGAGFDKATVRTKSGHFIFTGRVGSTVTTEARHRAIVVARPGSLITDLVTTRSTPSVKTARVNEPVTFTSTVTNVGSVTAIGCHFRSVPWGDLKTTFYTINPATGARLTADNLPLNIAKGTSRTYRVTISSLGMRDADFIDPEAIADCANNARTLLSLRGGFDISTSAAAQALPAINITALTPTGGVLNVPPGGSAFLRFRATNTSTTTILDATPGYIGFYTDPANTRYTVAICRTSLATGACLAPYAGSVTYLATKNVAAGFSVRVTAPTGSPAYDPERRRVVVRFKLAKTPYFHIAVPSIAVRKQ